MVVMELLTWKAPGVLILLVILLCFNCRVPQNLKVGFCEFFAGQGQISLALWSCGVKGSSHDLLYSNLMDLCSPHGFAFLDLIMNTCSGYMIAQNLFSCVYTRAGNKWSVEHYSGSFLHVWHLLQFIHKHATWLVIGSGYLGAYIYPGYT